MQSHTYAGSSVRALITATDVLNETTNWLENISKLGMEMKHIFGYLNKFAEGMVNCNGQGLMWGGVFSRKGQCEDEAYRNKLISSFKKHCDQAGILPYHVPVGGFMVSPVFDVDVGTIYEVGQRLEEVISKTMAEVRWKRQSVPICIVADSDSSFDVAEIAKGITVTKNYDTCLPQFHAAKSCTSCSSFVCQKIRTRFVKI